jgi:RHS repeat-associated protein
MTVTVEHPATTATVEVTREIDNYKTLNLWAYTVAANSNTWTLTRKIWNGSAWDTAWSKARANSTDGFGEPSITRTWKTAAGAAFYTGTIFDTTTKPWGATAGTSSTATDGGRSVSHYENPANPGSFGKLSGKTDRAGRIEAYEYDSNGRMTLRKSEWLDTVNSKHEIFDYTAHVSGETLPRNDYRPRTTTIKVEGGASTISKTMFAAHVDGTSGEYTEITKQAASPSAAWSDAANLVSIRTYYSAGAGAVQKGRLKQVTEPGGDVTTYDYAAGGTATSALTVTVLRELDSTGAPVAGRSSRSVTVHDALGRVRTVTRAFYEDVVVGWVDCEETTDEYSDGTSGALGYRYRQGLTDLVGSNDRIVNQYEWTGGRLTATLNEEGVETSFGYDIYGRHFSTTRGAIAGGSGYSAQEAVATTTTSTTPIRTGRRIGFKDEQTVTIGGALEMITSVQRDDWGRVTSSTDSNGYVTSYAYADSGRTITVTRPDGRTEISDRHKDGRIDSVTGTGVVAAFSSYAVNGTLGNITTTQYAATDGGNRYVESTANMLGQTVSIKRPSRNGASAATTEVIHHYEDGTGDHLRSSSSAANVPQQLFWEDATGTVRREISSTDDTINLETDRISESTITCELASGKLWHVERRYVYLSGSTPFHLSTSRTLLGGFAANEIARSESTNELSGQTTVSSTTLAGGVLTRTTDHPESTADSVSISYHGRLASSSQPGAGTTTYAYDDLGRRVSTVEPRTGASTVAYADHPTEAGYTTSLVGTVTDAAANPTGFEYHAQGTLGAGQVKKVTRPDTTATWTSYTALGQVQARWGAGIYATYHVYDSYGQMTALRTYQTLGHGTEPTSMTGGAAETEWNYDDATGLLLSKLHADDKGPVYTYDTAGRTKTRAWARIGADTTNPPLTTYSYTAFGELDTVVYANETEPIPDLDYDYDRLGRLDLVTQGAATVHDYIYDGTTLALRSEVIDLDIDRDGTADLVRELVHHRDGHLRNTGHQLGPEGLPSVALGTGYNYDSAGRLDRVWKDPTFTSGIPSGATLFTYSYRHAASGGLHVGTASAVGGGVADSGIVFHVAGPVHKVINSYEEDRDVLARKQNQENSGSDAWSKYVYSVNALGQRTALDLSLDPEVDGGTLVSSDVSWDYNARDEVVEADHEITAHDRAYSFDGIGNRTETAAGTTILTGTPDHAANSLNQYTKVEGTNLPAGAHDDDGNLVNDGTREYYWDSENRLVRVSGGTYTLAEYVYDHIGRRIAKIATAESPQGEERRIYFYDGWNLVGEYAFVEIPDPEDSEETIWSWELDFSYTWGLDLSQSLQGAGGVGGLLAVEKHLGADTGEYYPTYDGNGNVSEYLHSSGAQVAHYQYDPFGNQLSLSSGTLKDLFQHRFSTKYHDAESGFYYYGYRYFDPVTGRWPSRDPIGERGGVNLYGFVANDGLTKVDRLGLCKVISSKKIIGSGTNIKALDEPFIGTPYQNLAKRAASLLSGDYAGNAIDFPVPSEVGPIRESSAAGALDDGTAVPAGLFVAVHYLFFIEWEIDETGGDCSIGIDETYTFSREGEKPKTNHVSGYPPLQEGGAWVKSPKKHQFGRCTTIIYSDAPGHVAQTAAGGLVEPKGFKGFVDGTAYVVGNKMGMAPVHFTAEYDVDKTGRIVKAEMK